MSSQTSGPLTRGGVGRRCADADPLAMPSVTAVAAATSVRRVTASPNALSWDMSSSPAGRNYSPSFSALLGLQPSGRGLVRNNSFGSRVLLRGAGTRASTKEPSMPSARLLTILLASAGLVISGAVAAPQGKGPSQDRGQEKGQQQAAKHKHVHMNGHNLLGAKLKQNGHHEVGKLGNRTLTADVENGKVKNMAAGDLPAKRVKTTMKIASLEGGVIPVPAGG